LNNDTTNNIWKNAEGYTVTPDTSIAAYLLNTDTRLMDIVIHDGHGLFVFETDRETAEIVEQFQASGYHSYYLSYRDLLRRLHTAKRNQMMLRLREGNG